MNPDIYYAMATGIPLHPYEVCDNMQECMHWHYACPMAKCSSLMKCLLNCLFRLLVAHYERTAGDCNQQLHI